MRVYRNNRFIVNGVLKIIKMVDVSPCPLGRRTLDEMQSNVWKKITFCNIYSHLIVRTGDFLRQTAYRTLPISLIRIVKVVRNEYFKGKLINLHICNFI